MVAFFFIKEKHLYFLKQNKCFYFRFCFSFKGNLNIITQISGSVVKNPPHKQVTWVQSMGRLGPLEKEMATYSSILT